MKHIIKWEWLGTLAVYLILCTGSRAEIPSCMEIHAIARMAEAKSTAVLITWKNKAGNSYRAQLIFAFRYFQMHAGDQSAAATVLNLIPKNQEQDSAWHETGSLLCQDESYVDMRALGKFGVHLPHDLANAVLLVPSKMLEYVSYANTSRGDPDSDYAVQMQRVCLSRHREFVHAVAQLPPRG